MPKFSIIVPVYNVEPYIRECIESILNQSYTDFEVIVTDDRGSDNSIKIVNEYAKKDKRIKIVTHDRNRGLAAARNTALEHCSGKYIVCLDSDDWMEPHALATLYTVFQQAKTNSVWFNSRKFYDTSKTFADKPMYDQTEGYRTLTPDNIAAYADFTWIKAYTRKSIQRYNLKWPEGLTFEDGEFYFKYFTHNPKTYVIPDCLINYRHRENSIVREADRGNVKMQDIYDVVRHLREFWIKLGVYNRYKNTILKLIQNRIRMCYGLNYSDYNKQLSYQFLKDIKYPEDFSDFIPENDYTPLVSIVIPIYNVEKYINKCMDSVIKQTYKNIEIICIDDCGADNSVKIIEQYKKSDNRIKIIHHKKNKGLGAARNTGLKCANGKYILFVDSDDWLEKDCVELSIQRIVEFNLNTVMFKADVWWENTKERTPIWYKKYNNYQEGKFMLNSDELSSLPHYSWNKLYKTSFLVNNKIKWQEGVIYEDMEFFFRVFVLSPESYMIDKSLYVYRRRDNSIISNCYQNLTKAEDLYTVVKRIKDFLCKNNLMKEYYCSFLQLVCNNINNYREWPATENQLKPQMLKCLCDINFPDDFEQFKEI